MDEKQILTIACPFCAAMTEYRVGDTVAKCGSCDCSFDIKKAENNTQMSHYKGQSSIGGFGGGSTVITPAQAIDDGDNALAYINNYFDTFDWEEYQSTTEIIIDEIMDMVEKIKMKSAAIPSTWELEFYTLSTLINKKIEGLGKLRKEICDTFTGIDDTILLEKLDTVSKISSFLLMDKDFFLKTLRIDIAYFTKYGGGKTKAAEFTKQLEELEKVYTTVHYINDLYEIPEVKEKIAAKEKEILAKYADLGINAEEVYNQAVEAYQAKKQSTAIQLFESIKEYKDCYRYIALINTTFTFGRDYYRFGQYSFAKGPNAKTADKFATKGKKSSLLDLKNLKKHSNPTGGDEDEESSAFFALYPVGSNAIMAETPSINNVSEVLFSYGSYIYYIRKNKSIYVYDLDSSTSRNVFTLSGNATFVPFTTSNSHYFSRDGKKVVFKTTLDTSIKNKGCFKSLFSKKGKQQLVEKVNNFNLHTICLDTGSISCVKEEITDIVDVFKDVVFVTISSLDDEGNVITSLYRYNLDNHKVTSVLAENCAVHNVVNGHVIYTKWDPNSLNQDLFSFNMETGESKLIEDNIYNYFTTIEDKVYYTVGNHDYLPLFSNDIEGGDRKEILTDVEYIFAIKAGWMYAVKSNYGLNRRLYKISHDGKKRVFICSNFHKIVEVINGYIFFLDRNSNLRIVRSDGCKERIIAEDVDENNIIVSNEYIFFTRTEVTARRHLGASLYRLDLSGHNLKKLVFNVDGIKDYDSEHLYFSRMVVERYETITQGVKRKFSLMNLFKKQKDPRVINDYNVKIIYSYSKIDGTTTEILAQGRPKDHSIKPNKTGCSNPKAITVKYVKLDLPIKYERDDRAQAGELTKEQEEAARIASANKTGSIGGCSPLSKVQKSSTGGGISKLVKGKNKTVKTTYGGDTKKWKFKFYFSAVLAFLGLFVNMIVAMSHGQPLGAMLVYFSSYIAGFIFTFVGLVLLIPQMLVMFSKGGLKNPEFKKALLIGVIVIVYDIVILLIALSSKGSIYY